MPPFLMLTTIAHADIRRWGHVRIARRDGRWDRGISVGLVILFGLTTWALSGGVGLAGTIRDDYEDDSLYLALVAETRFDCAGMVSIGPHIGSGTLIASEYVLTAGHMVSDGATFTINGQVYQTTDYWQHPLWNATDPNDPTRVVAIDIGILKLSAPVRVSPAMLYEPSFGSEVDLDGTMVGFGYTGTGISGEILGTAGVKRAGQNTIDATGTYWGWSSDLLLVDFDSPDYRKNWLGSRTPLDLEMGPAHGDSGCGLFVELDGKTYLAGVQSAMWYFDGKDDASYGDGGLFVSVGNTIDWIDSIMPMPGDANCDGAVDAADAAYLTANWLARDANWSNGDFNADGVVNEIDASILAANWQAAASQIPAAVPEPHYAALLLGLLVIGLHGGRRRHLLKRPLL